ncbi:hypothetical protein RN001_014770 [Aquatica leii]|uniref:UDP-glucuronosyltransferase n=1 Tax=Aquatica leii TaxID=1421715 RepID=A0AAN7P021_9COLE|nr:hypothetical protein RN001_014770 [Aquatica leii]
MIRVSSLLCALISLPIMTNTARILGIVPSPSFSHQEVFQPIWRELSLRGHQVTTITTDPINDPSLVNLTEIDIHSAYKVWTDRIQKLINYTYFESTWLVLNLYEELGRDVLSQPMVQNLIHDRNESFDLVMIEHSVHAMFAFRRRFNAPVILITSMDTLVVMRTLMGSYNHPILYQEPYVPIPKNPTLVHRLVLVLLHFIAIVVQYFYVDPSQQKLVAEFFGPHYPPISELLTNISLVLSNSDPIFHKPIPLVPTIVQFGGGHHRKPPKPLPEELKRVLDAAENGFIYFSLGSNVKSKDLSDEKLNIIAETLGELPYTVLWKFEDKNLQNKPNNVITAKWFPQQDILKHPHLKVFITQGGLQSIDEAVYDHVPMVGIPFLGDQSMNVLKMVEKGFGLQVDHNTLNKDTFKATILEVINNPKYRNKVKELAELALDQPMSGLEKAIWWTEYVIRHNGTAHLRSPLLDVPYYQYYFLDVFAIFVVALIVLFKLSVFVFRVLVKILRILPLRQKIKEH